MWISTVCNWLATGHLKTWEICGSNKINIHTPHRRFLVPSPAPPELPILAPCLSLKILLFSTPSPLDFPSNFLGGWYGYFLELEIEERLTTIEGFHATLKCDFLSDFCGYCCSLVTIGGILRSITIHHAIVLGLSNIPLSNMIND